MFVSEPVYAAPAAASSAAEAQAEVADGEDAQAAEYVLEQLPLHVSATERVADTQQMVRLASALASLLSASAEATSGGGSSCTSFFCQVGVEEAASANASDAGGAGGGSSNGTVGVITAVESSSSGGGGGGNASSGGGSESGGSVSGGSAAGAILSSSAAALSVAESRGVAYAAVRLVVRSSGSSEGGRRLQSSGGAADVSGSAPPTLDAVRLSQLRTLVVDSAYCISQWRVVPSQIDVVSRGSQEAEVQLQGSCALTLPTVRLALVEVRAADRRRAEGRLGAVRRAVRGEQGLCAV